MPEQVNVLLFPSRGGVSVCAAGLLAVALVGGCAPGVPSVDPCADVNCPTGESCVNGACVSDQPSNVSFSNDIQPIFDQNCTVCHVNGGIAGFTGLFLGAATSFDLLVNQASSQNSALTRVVPGDSASSLLFLKINSDRPPVGSRMPLGRAPLRNDLISLIQTWIDQGAENN